MVDSLTGLTGYAAYRMMNPEVSLRKYIEQRAAAIQAKQRQISCGTAQKVKAADPVDEFTPKVPEIADDVAGMGSKSNELVLKGTNYSAEYAQKLQDVYKVFNDKGYRISEHGLNRILGRINQGKIDSINSILDVLNTGTKYIDTINGGTVIFKDGISVHIAEDGFIKTVIGGAKIKSTWEWIE